MRRYTSAIVLIVLASIVTGCKSAPDQETDGAASATSTTQSVDLGELSYIFEIPAEPVDVAATLDTEGTVEALIPVEGGSITATGADGTVYTLEIPSDALLNETLIGLTPVTSVADLPFGGEQTYAVQLSPEGLFLQNYAILTITPAVEIPIENQIVFGYLKTGSDLILAAPVVDSSEIKINVLHFSGNGVTNALIQVITSVRELFGGNVERRLENALAEQIGIERQRQLLGQSQGDDPEMLAYFAEVLRQYEEQVIKPRVAAAGDSCDAGKLALETVIAHERLLQLIGASQGSTLDKYPGLFDKAARACIHERFEECVEHHRIWWILPLYEGLVQQNSQLHVYSQGTMDEARDLTIKCLTFRLEFESTGKLVTDEGGGYESSVTSEVILRYDPEKGFILGAVAELVNTDFEFHWPCDVTTATGNGVFAVLGMYYEIDGGDPDEDGNYPDVAVSDIGLHYTPGTTLESVTMEICGSSGPPMVLSPFPAWTPTFLATHIHEMGESGGFVARDWEVYEDELFAEKEWDLVSFEEPGISEEGSFKLYHEPGG